MDVTRRIRNFESRLDVASLLVGPRSFVPVQAAIRRFWVECANAALDLRFWERRLASLCRRCGLSPPVLVNGTPHLSVEERELIVKYRGELQSTGQFRVRVRRDTTESVDVTVWADHLEQAEAQALVLAGRHGENLVGWKQDDRQCGEVYTNGAEA